MACRTSPPSAAAPSAKTGGDSPRRFTIYFQDDAVRARSEENARQVLQHAMDDTGAAGATSNSAMMARKALKYRNVYARMEGVDVSSPDFNASKFLGVDWCKTSSLRAFCEAQS